MYQSSEIMWKPKIMILSLMMKKNKSMMKNNMKKTKKNTKKNLKQKK